MLDVIKKITGYKEDSVHLSSAYLGHTIGSLLERVMDILDAYYLTQEQDEKRKWLSDFRILFKNDYASTIRSKATLTENKSRRKKNLQDMPTSKDISNFQNFLKGKQFKSLSYLQSMKKWDADSLSHWYNLLNSTMIKLLVFNRRRPGEIQRIEVEDFLKREDVSENDEYYQILPESDKVQCKKYCIMRGQGKRIDGIDSSVYMQKTDVQSLNIIIKYRARVGIKTNNKFLFAVPNVNDDRTKHALAYNECKRLVNECQKTFQPLEKPDALTATLLRKQFATKYSTFKDDEKLNEITNHLAHTNRTHFSRYRQITNKSKADITRILEKVNNGSKNMSSDLNISEEVSEKTVPEKEICSKSDDEIETAETSKLNIDQYFTIILIYILIN